MRLAVVGENKNDTARIAAALQEWAQKMPAGSATVTSLAGRPVDVIACDPDQAAAPSSGVLSAAKRCCVGSPTVLGLAARMLLHGRDVHRRRCDERPAVRAGDSREALGKTPGEDSLASERASCSGREVVLGHR